MIPFEETSFRIVITSRIACKNHESKPKPESRITPTAIPLGGEQHTTPEIQYGGGSLNRSEVAKINQSNVDEPYFRPIKYKDGIIMYIVDHRW